MTFFNKFTIFCDSPQPWGLYSQDSASPQIEALIGLHDNIMFYLVIILFGVAWIMVSIIRNYLYNNCPISNKYINKDTLIQLIWTITPALILSMIPFAKHYNRYIHDYGAKKSIAMSSNVILVTLSMSTRGLVIHDSLYILNSFVLNSVVSRSTSVGTYISAENLPLYGKLLLPRGAFAISFDKHLLSFHDVIVTYQVSNNYTVEVTESLLTKTYTYRFNNN